MTYEAALPFLRFTWNKLDSLGILGWIYIFISELYRSIGSQIIQIALLPLRELGSGGRQMFEGVEPGGLGPVRHREEEDLPPLHSLHRHREVDGQEDQEGRQDGHRWKTDPRSQNNWPTTRPRMEISLPKSPWQQTMKKRTTKKTRKSANRQSPRPTKRKK